MARGPIPDFPPDRPTVTEAMAAIQAYYEIPGNSVGGSLHIVLDDKNLDEHFIHYCREYAQREGDSKGVELAEMLLAMTPTQRRKATSNWWRVQREADRQSEG